VIDQLHARLLEDIPSTTNQTGTVAQYSATEHSLTIGPLYLRLTLIPCHLDIARSGLKARSVLNDLNTFKFSFSSINKLKTDTCNKKKPAVENTCILSLPSAPSHTYEDNDKIEDGPKRSKILPEAKGNPL